VVAAEDDLIASVLATAGAGISGRSVGLTSGGSSAFSSLELLATGSVFCGDLILSAFSVLSGSLSRLGIIV